MSNEVVIESNTIPEINNLIQVCTTISNEAFNVDDISRMIQVQFAKLSVAFKDISRLMTTWDHSKPDVLNATSITRLLSKGIRFTDIEEITIYKPAGFRGRIAEYVDQWANKQLHSISGVIDNVLLEGKMALGYYINDPANLNDSRIAVKAIPTGFRLSDIEQLITTESKWYPKDEHNGEATISSLFYSNKDIVDTLMFVNKINDTRWQKANPQVVSKEFLSYNGLAEALFTTISSGEYKASRVVIKEIADRVELTARWLELFSLLTLHIGDMTTALKLSEGKLLKSL